MPIVTINYDKCKGIDCAECREEGKNCKQQIMTDQFS